MQRVQEKKNRADICGCFKETNRAFKKMLPGEWVEGAVRCKG